MTTKPTKPKRASARNMRLEDEIWDDYKRVAELMGLDRTNFVRQLGIHVLREVKTAAAARKLLYGSGKKS